jgi:hypothetical protein
MTVIVSLDGERTYTAENIPVEMVGDTIKKIHMDVLFNVRSQEEFEAISGQASALTREIVVEISNVRGLQFTGKDGVKIDPNSLPADKRRSLLLSLPEVSQALIARYVKDLSRNAAKVKN